MPPAVKALPAIVRKQLARACEGDWSRVTVDDRGAATVHNTPQAAQKAYRRIELPPVLPKARRAPRKAAQKVIPPTPRSEGKVVRHERHQDYAVPTLPDISTYEEKPPKAEPEPPKESWLIRLPGDPDGEGYNPDPEEVMRSAHALRNQVARGIGYQLPLIFYREVLATTGIDLEEAESIVRNCTRVEVRPESAAKKYPVLRFVRGDVDVIVGFRIPREPCVIRVNQNALLVHDTYRVERHGGGGAKKSSGLPHHPDKIRENLVKMGCEIAAFPLDGKAVDVKYKGQNLGKLQSKAYPSKTAGQNAWQGFVRKWDAINRKS